MNKKDTRLITLLCTALASSLFTCACLTDGNNIGDCATPWVIWGTVCAIGVAMGVAHE